MVKLMALLFKKSGLTDEEFNSYWIEKHGPLAARIIPGLRKYTQSHFIRRPDSKSNYGGDGFAELWFDDLDAIRAFSAWRQTAAGQLLLEDEGKFMDGSKTVRYIVEEHRIIE